MCSRIVVVVLPTITYCISPSTVLTYQCIGSLFTGHAGHRSIIWWVIWVMDRHKLPTDDYNAVKQTTWMHQQKTSLCTIALLFHAYFSGHLDIYQSLLLRCRKNRRLNVVCIERVFQKVVWACEQQKGPTTSQVL